MTKTWTDLCESVEKGPRRLVLAVSLYSGFLTSAKFFALKQDLASEIGFDFNLYSHVVQV
jgi:hypothetical protein